MSFRTLVSASVAAVALLSASAVSAQERMKFEFWHGLTGKLGEIVEEHCKRFNDSQSKYEAKCIGQGGYDKAEQNTIAAFRSKQHPTMVQIYDAGTVNFMLSGVTYNAPDLAKDHGMKVDWANYFPGISNYYATSKGQMWSFPYNSSTALLYWNKNA
jgi:sn-glycerol 3-phosphate transport system substrate-binding protein